MAYPRSDDEFPAIRLFQSTFTFMGAKWDVPNCGESHCRISSKSVGIHCRLGRVHLCGDQKHTFIGSLHTMMSRGLCCTLLVPR